MEWLVEENMSLSNNYNYIIVYTKFDCLHDSMRVHFNYNASGRSEYV